MNWAEKKSERIRKLKNIYTQSNNENNLFTKNLKETVTKEILQAAF